MGYKLFSPNKTKSNAFSYKNALQWLQTTSIQLSRGRNHCGTSWLEVRDVSSKIMSPSVLCINAEVFGKLVLANQSQPSERIEKLRCLRTMALSAFYTLSTIESGGNELGGEVRTTSHWAALPHGRARTKTRMRKALFWVKVASYRERPPGAFRYWNRQNRGMGKQYSLSLNKIHTIPYG